MQSERVVEAHEGEGAAPSAVTIKNKFQKIGNEKLYKFWILWYNINIKWKGQNFEAEMYRSWRQKQYLQYRSKSFLLIYGDVAQLVVQRTCNA